MTEQRFLGELLARRGVVPADKLESLCGRSSASAGSTCSTCS